MIFNLQIIKLNLKGEKDHTTKWQSWNLMSNHLILGLTDLMVITGDEVRSRTTEGIVAVPSHVLTLHTCPLHVLDYQGR